MRIERFSPRYETDVIDLILGIQRGEFGIDVTLEDQPDLLAVPDFYQRAGDFWVALDDAGDDRLIGTIALIDFGGRRAALRKMFVRSERRGAEPGVASRLLLTAVDWCHQNTVQEIYLGTVSVLDAARRFYEKNRFAPIDKRDLPADFPIMDIDTHFYRRRL